MTRSDRVDTFGDRESAEVIYAHITACHRSQRVGGDVSAPIGLGRLAGLECFCGSQASGEQHDGTTVAGRFQVSTGIHDDKGDARQENPCLRIRENRRDRFHLDRGRFKTSD
jgi:hypothetical protein